MAVTVLQARKERHEAGSFGTACRNASHVSCSLLRPVRPSSVEVADAAETVDSTDCIDEWQELWNVGAPPAVSIRIDTASECSLSPPSSRCSHLLAADISSPRPLPRSRRTVAAPVPDRAAGKRGAVDTLLSAQARRFNLCERPTGLPAWMGCCSGPWASLGKLSR